MSEGLVRAEEGQALAIVAISMFVLMGAIGLSVDWGYSFLTRRDAQNAADAATLGAGRYLASSYIGGAAPFDVSQEDVWCEARRHRDANARPGPTTLTRSLTVSFFSAVSSVPLASISTADCAAAGSTSVPASTALLRVQVDTNYTSLFGAITRRPIAVSTTARVRLTGSAWPMPTGTPVPGVRGLQLPSSEIPGVGLSGRITAPAVAMWPIVKHFEAGDYVGAPCGQYCDTTSRRFRLWPDSDSSGKRFGSFTGLVTYAHYSPRERPDQAHQIITESDYSGTANGHHGHPTTGEIANSDPSACGGAALWDTNGGILATAATCDLPNWFYYGYRGSHALGTDWQHPSWAGFEGAPRALELPSVAPAARESCGTAPAYFPTPSCTGTDNLIGDWVETIAGDMTTDMADGMRSFIQRYGRLAPNGLGRAVVVHVFLWDCAEHYDAARPVGDRWSMLNASGSDGDLDGCRVTRQVTRNRSVDRVHLVSVVPVTVYEADVFPGGSSVVYAYWGNVFADAGACGVATPPSGCSLNPLINSAFLVPDE
jgi:hypothetical protein